MSIEDIQIPAMDGFQLAATLYLPDRRSKIERFVLISSAMGVKRRYYDAYARFLCEQGLAVLTFDFRGIGDSRPSNLRHFEASMIDWAEKDIAGTLEWIVAEHEPERLLVVGHSVGGQLIGVTPNNDKISGLLAVAVQSGYWGLWPVPRRYLLAALWYLVMPTVTIALGYFPARRVGLGAEDLPRGVALQWARWGRHPEYIVDDEGKPVRRYFEAFKAPILCYSIEDDLYAPQAAVEYLLDCYVNAPREARHLRPRDLGVRAIGHFGFFREKFKPLVWHETADWLRQQ